MIEKNKKNKNKFSQCGWARYLRSSKSSRILLQLGSFLQRRDIELSELGRRIGIDICENPGFFTVQKGIRACGKMRLTKNKPGVFTF